MNSIIEILQKSSLRLSFCALAFGLGSQAFAQDEVAGEATDAETTAVKQPKRPTISANYTLKTLNGVVIDQVSKAPVSGIQLQVLGNKMFTAMTDENGKFSIKVPDFTTSLYVFAPEFMSQQVAVAGLGETDNIEIKMMKDKFGAMYDDNTSYTASSTFKSNNRGLTIDAEIGNTIGGDVRSISRSGAPSMGNSMFVRGLGSINSNAQPLVVIDGVEQDMQLNRSSLHDGQFNNILANISPDDIESVQLLKNATALYGSRGANGVLLINTKRGHSMATRIDANISVGVSLIPQLPTMMNAAQYRSYATEILGTVPEIQKLSSNEQINFRFLDDNPDGYYYHTYHNDTDWQDYVYRNALTQNYSINVQGGDNVGMYNLSVGYVDAQSTVEENKFDRMNVRFNTDIEILPILKTKFDLSIARTNNEILDDGAPSDLSAGAITSPTFLSMIKSPLLNPYQYNKVIGGFSSLLSEADDLYSQLSSEYSLGNPVAILENATGDHKNKAENTYFNIRLEPTVQLGGGFSLTEMLSYTLNRNSQRYYRPYGGMPSFYVEGLGSVTSKTVSLFSKQQNFVTDTRLNWKRLFEKHSFAAFAGFRYNTFSFDNSDLSTEFNGETNDKNPTLDETPYPGVFGVDDTWKVIQWYGNVDYNFMNRYFATLSLTGEANSRFGENADGLDMFGVKWAIFPSVQLGWVVTNESWFPKNAGINYLRINAGFDMSGNDDISNYAARTSFSSVKYHNNLNGLQLTNIGNDEIKWEMTTKWNVGFESYLLDNRLGLAFDYFIHKTSDLLTLKSFKNPIGGINNYWSNGGELENTGFEAKVSFKPVVLKDWNVEVGATVGHYKNKVTQLPDGDYTTSICGTDNILTSVGNPVAMFYGYETAGIFSTDAEAKAAGKDGYLVLIDNTGAEQPFKAGDVHFVDRNDDGKITDADKTIIGDPNPDIYGNIFATVNWKDLTLSLGFNYSLGNDVYNYQRSLLNSGSTFYNQQVAETGRWRYEGQVAELPRATFGDPMGNNRFSDRWIEDGSYLRLKTVNLSYNVPIPSSWTTWLQGLTIWAEGQNLLTFTKYLGSDPEFSIGNGTLYQGIDSGYLAQGRSFTFGVKINL